MNKKLAVFLTLTFASVSGSLAEQAAHPYVGTWKFALPNGCVETYINRSDGTHLGFSRDEAIETSFVISEKENVRGFYVLEDTVVKVNGKRDCSGGITPVGDKVKLFVKFNPSRTMMMICANESMNACFGPAVRQMGSAT
jgi:hypothetical protein